MIQRIGRLSIDKLIGMDLRLTEIVYDGEQPSSLRFSTVSGETVEIRVGASYNNTLGVFSSIEATEKAWLVSGDLDDGIGQVRIARLLADEKWADAFKERYSGHADYQDRLSVSEVEVKKSVYEKVKSSSLEGLNGWTF